MSDALVRAKLVSAYQSLQESSNAYDSGCMEIKEILDNFLSEKAVYTKKYTEAEHQEIVEKIVQEKLKPYIDAMQEFVDRCDNGEVRSSYTYAKFKNLIKDR